MTSGADAWLVDERWFKAYPLADRTTIGRGSECTIIVRDPAVSRVHAEVHKDGIAYVLRTRGSSGTRMNGERVSGDCVLQESDIIEIAFTSLRFTTHAPTGEMFIVPRDAPTSIDSLDVPTRATLHSMHPITLVSRARRYKHRVWIVVLIAALLLFLLAVIA